ncbi:MAG: phosphatase PAP2 family protein [Gemmatimonadaceae bacterium]
MDLTSRLIAVASIVSLAVAGSPGFALGQDSTAWNPARTGTLVADSSDSVGLSAKRPAEATADPGNGDPWFTRRDAFGAGIAILATVAVAPLDRPISGEFRELRWQKDEKLRSASQVLAFGGGPGPFILGAGFYAMGKVAGSQRLASAGAHITEAVLLAAGVTAIGKGIAGRALPGINTKEQFEWGRGFHHGNGPFVAFPSGHTAAAFALAATLTGEAADWHPGLQRYVGPVSYLTATGVGLARLYQNVHWASDLPLAAAIGTWAGATIESREHAGHRRKVIERIAEATSIARAVNGRTMVSWSLPLTIPSGGY